MVGGERGLEAVDGLGPVAEQQSGVVHQHVESRGLVEDLGRAPAHRRHVGQVENDELDAGIRTGAGGDRRHGGPAALRAAGGDDDPRAHGGQSGRGLEPDPGVASGDDDRLLMHVGNRRQTPASSHRAADSLADASRARVESEGAGGPCRSGIRGEEDHGSPATGHGSTTQGGASADRPGDDVALDDRDRRPHQQTSSRVVLDHPPLPGHRHPGVAQARDRLGPRRVHQADRDPLSGATLASRGHHRRHRDRRRGTTEEGEETRGGLWSLLVVDPREQVDPARPGPAEPCQRVGDFGHLGRPELQGPGGTPRRAHAP